MGKRSEPSDYRFSRYANVPRYGTKTAAVSVSADNRKASRPALPPTHSAECPSACAWRHAFFNLWNYSLLSRRAAAR